MARFRIEVDAPAPFVVDVSTIKELHAKVAEVVAAIEQAAVSQIPLAGNESSLLQRFPAKFRA